MLTHKVRDHFVRKLPRRSRLGALGATLRVCGPDEADAVLGALLDSGKRRPSIDALEAAARNWGRLTPERRADLLRRAEDPLALINALGASKDAEARSAAAALIADAPALRGPAADAHALGAPIERLLRDHHADVRNAAVDTVLSLARVSMHDDTEYSVRSLFDCVLAHAAATYPEHRRREVMEHVVRNMDHPGPCLQRWLASPDEPGRMALRAALRRERGPLACARAMRLLADPALGAAAMETLSSVTRDEEREAALARPALLRDPRRRARLARLAPAEGVLGDDGAPDRLTPEARAGWIELVTILPMDDATRLARLATRLADNDPTVRARAALACAGLRPSAQRDGLLHDFACAADAPVAIHALRTLLCDRDPARERELDNALRTLTRSAHPEVRALACGSLDAFDAATDSARARVAMLRGRDDFVRDLRAQAMREADPGGRIHAARLAKRLGVAPELELELLACAASADADLSAAAAAALRGVPTATAHTALARLCNHADERVRANAVDALGAREPSHPAVRRATRDPAARVVAGALGARARGGRADEPERRRARRDLLCSEDPTRRLAGLWCAARAGDATDASLVAHRLRLAADEHERRLAAACARRLLLRLDASAKPATRAPAPPVPSVSPAHRKDTPDDEPARIVVAPGAQRFIAEGVRR